MKPLTFIRFCRGTTMTEALIALLVLTVGILGMVSLQIKAKQNHFDAMQRITAAELIQDIFQRMRSNATVLSSYAVEELTGKSTVSKDCNKESVTCSAAELATYDLQTWDLAIAGVAEQRNELSVGGLVNPTACITHSNSQVSVTIVWRGHEEMVDPDPSNNCGRGKYGTSDNRRQILSMTGYIGES